MPDGCGLPLVGSAGIFVPNYHALSDFRSQGGKQLDNLMRQLRTGLVSNHILTLRRVSQEPGRSEGARHAGAASFWNVPL